MCACSTGIYRTPDKPSVGAACGRPPYRHPPDLGERIRLTTNHPSASIRHLPALLTISTPLPVAFFPRIRYNGPVIPPHPYTRHAAYLENAAHLTPGRVTAVRT